MGIAGLLSGEPVVPEVKELSWALPATIQADSVRESSDAYAEAIVPAWDQFDLDIEHEKFHVALGNATEENRGSD